MLMGYEPEEYHVVRIVSKEFAIDNFYIDDEGGYVYQTEDDWETNKRSPVFENIEIECLGTVQRIAHETFIEVGDFIETEYNIEDNPEYFI